MTEPESPDILNGVDVWNTWRREEPSIVPNLSGRDLHRTNLVGANLSKMSLFEANLFGVNLRDANLQQASLWRANLGEADLTGADLSGADLAQANLSNADLSEANLSEADLRRADLTESKLRGTNLGKANLRGALLGGANLWRSNLSGARLMGANFREANLSEANLDGADLSRAVLVETNLEGAVLTGCRIYGISAWGVKLTERTKQQGLIITRFGEPPVTVDDLEVAQFVYLLLHNEKLRKVIDTVGKKGVLLLGRFTEGRIAVLERLRDAFRERGYLPIVFNFDKPETKDFTETVRLLAGMSKFVIADITNPKSAPLELQATVPEIMVPFRPIIEEGEEPFSMLQDLWIKHRDWVFEPIHYSSVDALIASLDEKIIQPAEARFVELLKRKAETMGGEHV
jgi:uncharacterized protein YjbI with pentapeptide repeats